MERTKNPLGIPMTAHDLEGALPSSRVSGIIDLNARMNGARLSIDVGAGISPTSSGWLTKPWSQTSTEMKLLIAGCFYLWNGLLSRV